MRFYILLFLVTCSYAFDFNCLKGPEYWCSSYSNALKCDRIIECKAYGQNRQNGVVKMTTGVNEIKCDVCEKLIADLEKSFIPQFTEQQFIDYVINKICPKLPSDYKGLCTTMVRQYGHDIYVQMKALLNPAFLCKSMNACGTISLDSLKLKSPETCKVCKEVFSVLENLLSNVTPDELKSILKLVVCDRLPGPTKTMCDTLVDGYTNQVYELLKSLLDGDRVCPAIHLCATKEDVTSTAWDCQSCIDIVVVLKKDLVNVSAADIENLAKDKVCSKLSVIVRGICDDKVDQYVPMFIADLNSPMTPQQLCAKNSLCMAPPSVKKNVEESVKGVIECDACELAVGEVKKLLLSKDGISKAKTFVKTKVCIYFGSEAQECVNFVDKYADILISFINSQLTNRQICEMFGACSESDKVTKPILKVRGIECEGCKLLLTEIKKYVDNPTHKANLKNLIRNKLCAFLSKEMTQCQQAVDEYFDIIYNALVGQLDADKICQLLKYCSAVKMVKTPLPSSTECELCEIVMSEVIDLVTTNASQQRIMNFLTANLCPKLGVLSNECVTVVSTYVPFLFQLAREGLNSKILCSRLHLCALVSKKNVEAVLKIMQVKSFQCNLCQFAVNETRTLMSDPKIQTMVENFLKQEVCSHFGAKQQECVNDINEYYSFVVNVVLQYLTPSLCSDVHLCATLNVQNNRQPMLNLIKSKKTVDCETCSLFYKLLKTININTPSNDIVLGLVSVCSRFYHEDKTKCLNHLRHLDMFFESFKNAKNERQFCEMNRMCSGKQETVIVGQKQCSWGPGFWCISRAHAEFCGIGAVRHCELKVWLRADRLP